MIRQDILRFFLFFLHFYCPRNREGHSPRNREGHNYSLILSIRYQFAFVKITCSLLCDVDALVDILFFCCFFSEFRYIFNLLYILKKVIEPLAHVFH